ncbi:4-aminobutyrate aminotransferase [Psychrobacter sp. P11F6]|uniref:2-aminoadipate transaminase n=1 Tax=Psychrobacter sp. P11F6 TaxID=1699621 RepID=UPI00071511B8|nr:aspartate aminotransferase family protein [Psychrobacter sp. P11F6]KRG34788.1 4-aminobutyrate aminotransferase [Psychrobacter sp. P11F6]
MDKLYNVTDAFTMVHPITLTKGKNAKVWDNNDQCYIDFVGGIGVLNFGHCHPHIVTAIINQTQSLIHYAYNAAAHTPYQTFMPRLCELIPISGELSGMLTNSGAEATENAIKIARLKTQRVGVIAFDGGFHGRTLAAVNLNGKVAPYKRGLGPLAGSVYHIPFPSPDNEVSDQQAIDALNRLFEVETDISNIGAIIAEPIQGEGGFQLMSPSFAQYLRAFCDEHGILLIMDEIQSGYGRTGSPFAFSHLGIEPDVILLGKSIAGGLPLGAVVGKASVINGLPKGSLGGTYSGNPVACAAANATIDIMQEDEIWASAKHYAQEIETSIAQWQAEGVSPWLYGLTGIGAMRGIELRHATYGSHPSVMTHVLTQARKRGLLLMPSGKYRHIIRLLPPLTIEPETLQDGLDILRDVLSTIPNKNPVEWS